MKSESKLPQAARLRIPFEIYGEDVGLSLDGVLITMLEQGTRIHPRLKWMDRKDIIWFGRRTLEVAVHQSIDAEQTLELGAYKQDWLEAHHAAERAKNSILAFIKTLVPSGQFTTRLDKALAPAMMNLRLHHPSVRGLPPSTFEDQFLEDSKVDSSEGESISIKRRLQLAEADSTFVFCTYETLAAFADHAKISADSISLNRPNPGAPGKKAFVKIFAESWVFLTGKRPGTQPERNPFLDLIRAAWADAGGDEHEEFSWTIRSVAKELKIENEFGELDRSTPYWL